MPVMRTLIRIDDYARVQIYFAVDFRLTPLHSFDPPCASPTLPLMLIDTARFAAVPRPARAAHHLFRNLSSQVAFLNALRFRRAACAAAWPIFFLFLSFSAPAVHGGPSAADSASGTA